MRLVLTLLKQERIIRVGINARLEKVGWDYN